MKNKRLNTIPNKNIVLLKIQHYKEINSQEQSEIIKRDNFISDVETKIFENNYNRPDITVKKIRELFHHYNEGK